MMKLAFGLLKNDKGLWIEVLRNKYKNDDVQASTATFRTWNLNLWKGIPQAWLRVKNAFNLVQSDGENKLMEANQ